MRDYLLEHHRASLIACGMESCNNFEHVMETTLQLCILRPLSHYVYLRIEEYYTSNGYLYQVQRSIQQGKLKKLEDFGIRVSCSVFCTLMYFYYTCTHTLFRNIWLFLVRRP